MMPPPPPPMPQMAPNPHGPYDMEANNDKAVKSVPHWIILSMNAVNTITQLLLGGVVFSAFFAANVYADINSIFIRNSYSVHIYLCVTGYMILMTQAVLTIDPYAGWSSTLMYPQKRTIHWLMQITGSCLAIIGSGIKLADLDTNFATPHGITGFVAMLLTSVSLIGGIINLMCAKRIAARVFKIFHVCVGSLTLIMAYTCLCLAFSTHYRLGFQNIGDKNANYSIIITVFALVGILVSAFGKMFINR